MLGGEASGRQGEQMWGGDSGGPERLDQLRSLGKRRTALLCPGTVLTPAPSPSRECFLHTWYPAGAMGSSSEPAVRWSFLTAMNRRSRVQETRSAGVLPCFSENKS